MSRDVAAWLEELGLGQHADAFAENGIGFDLVPELTNEDLKDLGIARLADRKRLLKAIADLASATPAREPPAEPTIRKPEAERRQLTVMFCDLVDSTPLSSALDPEELRELLLAYQAACAGVVERYDGHIAKYIGDGLLIYFGLPRAHEDDAQRAVSAGLGIVEAVVQLSRELVGDIGIQLSVRVGVHTGLVVAGEMGAGGIREEMAIVGETPNIAARLQALATPNAVLISAATRRLVSDLFSYEDLGVQALKGLSNPMQVWRVTGERSAESRFAALHVGGLVPLIGREGEVDLLSRRWEQAQDGEGQVVLLGGEPGIGKSRIIEALLERIGDRPHIRVRCQCSPYFANTALHPFSRQLAQAADLLPTDTPEIKLDKLERLLKESEQVVPESAPLFAALLSIPSGSTYGILDLPPPRLKERTMTALVDRVLSLAKQRPVLFVVEDAHWIDPSSEELIAAAIDRLHHARVLMVITHRPDYAPPWIGHSHVTMLMLNRLSRLQAADLVREWAANTGLPADTIREIVAKADGVPLFVEELTKAVLEAGPPTGSSACRSYSGTPQLTVPATLQDTLVARLDRSATTREVAQTAAVLGREFSEALLTAVSSLPSERLSSALNELVQAGLLFRQTSPPTRYVFKHALVQDAAYGTLLSSARQQLHARTAAALEQHFPGIAEAQPELLAYHYEAAGIREKAIAYWQRSAALARDRSNYAEAERHLTSAIALVPHLPDEGDTRKLTELDLQMALGAVYRALRGSGSPHTERTYARARALCEEVGDADRLLEVLYGQFICVFNRPKLHDAERYAREFMEVARRDAKVALPVAHQLTGLAAFLLGDLQGARTNLEHCLQVEGSDPTELKRFSHGQHPSSALTYLSWLLFAMGYPEQALARDRKAVAVSEGAFLYAMALGNSCCLHQMRGDCAGVEANLAGLIDLAGEKGIVVFHGVGRLMQGWTRACRGAIDEGLELMRDALMKLAATEQRVEHPYKRAVLSEIYLRAGRLSEAEEQLREAAALIEVTDERWYQAEVYRLAGDLDWFRGDTEGAELQYGLALAVAKAQSARMWELRAAKRLAALWRETGKLDEARALLAPVLGGFTEGFDAPDLIEGQAILDELP